MSGLLVVIAIGLVCVVLLIMRHSLETRTAWEEFDTGAATKSAVLGDLFSALGYGGMIHEFKEYILFQDRARLVRLQGELRKIAVALTAYEALGVTAMEKAAIADIDRVVSAYETAVGVAERFVRDGLSPAEIAAAVRVDDAAALAALDQLRSELLAARQISGARVNAAVAAVNNVTVVSALAIGAPLIGLLIGLILFVHHWLTVPLVRLSGAMQLLAARRPQFDIEIPGTDRPDEIGGMARTVEVFKWRAQALIETSAALGENERRYRTLVETMVDGIITVDAEGQVQSVNRAAGELFGYLPEELVWKDVRMLMPEEVARALADLSNADLRESFAGSIGKRAEVIGRRKDGAHLSLEISVSEMTLEGIVHYSAHMRDITTRKKVEAERAGLIRELAQSQRLESLGTLAGGIAHEINTPAQYVRDNTQFLADAFGGLQSVLRCHGKLVEAAEDHPALAEIVAETKAAHADADLDFLVEEIPSAIAQSNEGLERVSGIVRAIKEFSHPGVQDKSDVDLHQVITTTATVARNQWKYVAELETDFDDAVQSVPGLAGELNQVFLNLIVNAAQAIEEAGNEAKGRIGIATRRRDDEVEITVIGATAMVVGDPEKYRLVLADSAAEDARRRESEVQHFGANHALMGAYLAGLWGLPLPVADAIAYHHDPKPRVADGFGTLACVHVAQGLIAGDGAAEPVVDMDYLDQLGVRDRLSGWRGLVASAKVAEGAAAV